MGRHRHGPADPGGRSAARDAGDKAGVQAWEQEFGPQLEETLGYDNKFPPPAEEIEALPCQAKLAYVARLLRTMALAYGVSADYSRVNGIVVGDNHPGTPAALIRGLNDILWT